MAIIEGEDEGAMSPALTIQSSPRANALNIILFFIPLLYRHEISPPNSMFGPLRLVNTVFN